MASLVDRFIEQVALDYPDLVRRARELIRTRGVTRGGSLALLAAIMLLTEFRPKRGHLSGAILLWHEPTTVRGYYPYAENLNDAGLGALKKHLESCGPGLFSSEPPAQEMPDDECLLALVGFSETELNPYWGAW